MRRWIRTLCSIAAALIAAGASSAHAQDGVQRPAGHNFWNSNIWEEPDRGFLFYEPPQADKRQPAKRPDAQRSRRSLADITDHDELKREREQRLKLAVMNPTPANMRAYLEANTIMMQKSAMFADMWRRTVWQNSEFDFNVQNPQANFAQTSIKYERELKKKQAVADIARDYGVFFFARSDCPYCKLQAPVLRELSRQFGIEVMAITLDGGAIEGFPDARPDNGVSFRVSQGQGIQMVPALYLIARNSPEAVLLGAGVLAMDEIVERINVFTQLQPGMDVAGGIK